MENGRCYLGRGAAGSAALLALASLSIGCRKDQDEQGAAPPPIESSKPGVCQSGGGSVSDPVTQSFFPRVVQDYCIDPNGETRAYGEGAPGTLDEVCTQLFDGECEIYKGFGLARVTTVRFVDGKGSPATVTVTLSRFAQKDGAYAFFTKRVIADGDPLRVAPKPLDTGGQGALGTGISYVWRDQYVAELSYANELEAPAQLKASSARVLPAIAKALGVKLPGDTTLPKAAAALPTADRIPLGVAYQQKGVLGVEGAGSGAIGYYAQGTTRWRVAVLERPDEAASKDTLKTIAQALSGQRLKKANYSMHRLQIQPDESSATTEWVMGTNGSQVVAIGDEELVLSPDQSDEQQKPLKLSFEAKSQRLHEMLTP